MAAGAATAAAGQRLVGPYAAIVERVVDGDTLAVRVAVWIGQDLHVLVRLRGVDAPEMRGRCEAERAGAVQAKAAMARLAGSGAVILSNIEGDKYFCRVVADVISADGADVATALIAAGQVRTYDGRRRASWCADAAAAAVSDAAVQRR